MGLHYTDLAQPTQQHATCNSQIHELYQSHDIIILKNNNSTWIFVSPYKDLFCANTCTQNQLSDFKIH